MTSWLASAMVMKYRFMSGWVTVTGPPASICLRKIGDDAAAAPHHIAETHGHKSRAATGGVQGLHIQLSATFGRAPSRWWD